MNNIKIFIADDHQIVITGIKLVLSLQKNIHIIGSITNTKNIVEKIDKVKPDIVLMDIIFPDDSGINICKELLTKNPSYKIIFISSIIDEEIVFNAFKAGAYGYLPKDFSEEELLKAINVVAEGEKFIKGTVSDILSKKYLSETLKAPYSNKFKLTSREIEIIRLISEGLLNKQIANRLNISNRTVDAHKRNIMIKMNVTTTIEILILAIKNKIVEIN